MIEIFDCGVRMSHPGKLFRLDDVNTENFVIANRVMSILFVIHLTIRIRPFNVSSPRIYFIQHSATGILCDLYTGDNTTAAMK